MNNARPSSDDCSALESLSDEKLLRRIVSSGDQEAFRLVVERHGPLVMRVCAGILRNVHDAEDAFQATFLVLSEKCRRIRARTSLASWLHGTAYRVSVRAARRAARRPQPLDCEMAIDENTLQNVADRESEWLLHEELRRLPERYRAPLVLCYLQGKSRQEAAEEFRCSVDAVKGRLERARQQLRVRLTARGVTMAACGVVGAGIPQVAVCAPLVSSTIDVVGRLASGRRVPDDLLRLARGGSQMPGIVHWVAAASLLVVAVLACGMILLSEVQAAEDPLELLPVLAASTPPLTPDVIRLTASSTEDTRGGTASASAAKAMRLLRKNLESQEVMNHYAAKVVTEMKWQWASHGKPLSSREETWVRRDGSQVDLRGTTYNIHWNEDPVHFHRVISDGQYIQSFSHEDDGSFSQSGSRWLVSVPDAPLDGHLGNWTDADDQRITTLLAQSGKARWTGTEVIDETPTERIESEEEFGKVTLWIAPQKGHAILQANLEAPNTTEWLRDVRTQNVDGNVVPISARYIVDYDQDDGDHMHSNCTISRSAIDLSPSFDGAFQMDLPNGTLLMDRDNDAGGYTHMFQNGEIVPVDYAYLAQLPQENSRMTPWRWWLSALSGIALLAVVAGISWRHYRLR